MITGEVHCGIIVSDLERSIAFYRDVLGLTLKKREPMEKKRGEKLGVPGAAIEIAIFEYGENNQIELIKFHEPDSPNTYGHPVNAIGQVHIAFHVDDIAAEIERMASMGVEFVGGNNYSVIDKGPLSGWKWIYLKDPDGTNLELIEGELSAEVEI